MLHVRAYKQTNGQEKIEDEVDEIDVGHRNEYLVQSFFF